MESFSSRLTYVFLGAASTFVSLFYVFPWAYQKYTDRFSSRLELYAEKVNKEKSEGIKELCSDLTIPNLEKYLKNRYFKKLTQNEFDYHYKGNTLLHIAAMKNDLTLCKAVLDAMPSYFIYNKIIRPCEGTEGPFYGIDNVSECGYSALTIACQKNNFDIAKLIIDKGASVYSRKKAIVNVERYNWTINEGSWTEYKISPLHEAIKNKNVPMVKLLLGNDCYKSGYKILKMYDTSLMTPLMLALKDCNDGKSEIFDLIEKSVIQNSGTSLLQELIFCELLEAKYISLNDYNSSDILTITKNFLKNVTYDKIKLVKLSKIIISDRMQYGDYQDCYIRHDKENEFFKELYKNDLITFNLLGFVCSDTSYINNERGYLLLGECDGNDYH